MVCEAIRAGYLVFTVAFLLIFGMSCSLHSDSSDQLIKSELTGYAIMARSEVNDDVSFLVDKEMEAARNQEREDMMEKDERIKDEAIDIMDVASKMLSTGYAGNVLAGGKSLYLDFERYDYNKALAENKIIFLNFYSAWSSSCKDEEKQVVEAFNELNVETVIGFRVHYKDFGVGDFEKELIERFKIKNQHSKVIIKDRKRVLTVYGEWDKDRVISEMERFINKE